MHALTVPAEITPADRLGMTVFLAVIAHLVVILGVTFVPEDRTRNSVNTLDIILVQRKTEKEPEQADFLAQASQEGGGESDEISRPTTPLPAPFIAPEPEITATSVPAAAPQPVTPAPEPEPEPISETPPEPVVSAAARPIIAQTQAPSELKVKKQQATKSDRKVEPEPSAAKSQGKAKKQFAASKPNRAVDTEAQEKPEAKPVPAAPPQPTKTFDAATLVNRSLAMASLSAEINQKLKVNAARPRRVFISARTREHNYAAYLEAWRAKVERIGNLNYPDAARRKRLSGSLLLEVSINPDGSINEISLRRSSGEKVLDDAAVRIVKLAAPFARFPKAIAKKADILHIERTWMFLSSNKFSSR